MVLGLVGPSSAALAANQAYCDRLRTELAALNASMASNQSSETLAALKKAERERDKTISYSKSIGCDDVRIPLISGPTPSQCPALKAQVKQLDSTIAGLRDEAARGSGNEELTRRKADIAGAYELSCSGANAPQSAGGFAPPGEIPNAQQTPIPSGAIPAGSPFGQAAPPQAAPLPGAPASTKQAPPQPMKPAQKQLASKPVPKGLFESLFGLSSDNASDSEMPDSPFAESGVEASGGSRTICVRTCDGFFFPISPFAVRGRMQLDQELCKSSCPSADTKLYVQGIEADVETATSVDDGSPYTALPNAFKYRTSIDQACTCRAAGKTWAETLADAERILGVNGQTDGQITELKAQELSRPKEIKATRAKKIDLTPNASAAGQAVVPPDATIASIAPSAIPAGTSVVPVNQGEFREITAPDGTKKKIRILRAPGAAPVTSTEQN